MTFRFLNLPRRARPPGFPAPSRRLVSWRHSAGLLTLGLLLASWNGGTRPAPARPLVPAATRRPPITPANAPGASFTLTVDGVSEPVVSATLSLTPANSFVLGFESTKNDLTVLGGSNMPLAVGPCIIRDTSVMVTFGSESRQHALNKQPASNYLNAFPKQVLVDWGKGAQEQQGRRLGQIVFTRVADGSADGSFQSYVYAIKGEGKTEYKGRPWAVFYLKECLLKGTFKNLPYGDVNKALGDLQKTLDAMKLTPPSTKPRR